MAATLERLNQEKRKALVPFITAGDPDLEVTRGLIFEMEKQGADIIELGIPFSDSLADGPTIQRSFVRALEKGFSLKKILKMVADVRKQTEIPIILMTCYNLVFRYGKEKFLKDAVAAGVDGLIIPDLPVEETRQLQPNSHDNTPDLIYLLAPTSTNKRIELVSKASQGFIYYISVAGITGERKKLPREIGEKIRIIKTNSSLPVLVGFGISTPEQAKDAAKVSDGVIIGSAIVRIIEEAGGNKKKRLSSVGKFVKKVRLALDQKKTAFKKEGDF
ncbi:MAG: tryptophan synthase subunit alpha [Nitrospinota bacterium]